MKFDDLKHGFSNIWDSMAEGWQRLREGAVGALTRFRPGERSAMPARSEVDDTFYWPSHGWSLLGGDLFEDDQRLVVRLEIPGMEKDNFDIAVSDNLLTVSGEKRFEGERSEGRYRSFECAYGAFHRSVPLPASVDVDQAKATYRNGILKITLPKRAPARPKVSRIPVG